MSKNCQEIAVEHQPEDADDEAHREKQVTSAKDWVGFEPRLIFRASLAPKNPTAPSGHFQSETGDAFKWRVPFFCHRKALNDKNRKNADVTWKSTIVC